MKMEPWNQWNLTSVLGGCGNVLSATPIQYQESLMQAIRYAEQISLSISPLDAFYLYGGSESAGPT
jgi:hypothetical protein